MFELVIIWCTKEMEIIPLETLAQAEKVRDNMLRCYKDLIIYCDWRVKR